MIDDIIRTIASFTQDTNLLRLFHIFGYKHNKVYSCYLLVVFRYSNREYINNIHLIFNMLNNSHIDIVEFIKIATATTLQDIEFPCYGELREHSTNHIILGIIPLKYILMFTAVDSFDYEFIDNIVTFKRFKLYIERYKPSVK